LKNSRKNGAIAFPDNLVLIGMFGSGKTTVGKILAGKLRYHFVDVDHLIEARYRMPLQKVLDRLGMGKFMRMEDMTLRRLHYSHCVLSPGGSAVYYPVGMGKLRKLDPRVFLKVSLGELKRRMRDWSDRGVVRRGGNTLTALYRERAPLYRKYADLTVTTRGKSAERIANEILRLLNHQTPPTAGRGR
jgi:shikimate kinase